MQQSVARNRISPNEKPPQPTRKTKKVKKRNWKRFFTLLVLFLLLVGGGIAGAVYWKVDHALNEASNETVDGVNTIIDPTVDATYNPQKPISLVLLGFDARPETGSLNSDVMMVAVLNPATKKVTMVSIPRDTRVKIPGYSGYQKINAVFANGEAEKRQAERKGKTPTENGFTLTKKTLEDVLGIPIQHYVEVDFAGFKAVIDEVGGVQVNVDRRLVYDDPTDNTHINLKEGVQLLNGEQALGYVRHRHDNRGEKYYSSDFDRNRRQQEVIKAVVDKLTSIDGMTKVFNIIDIAGQHIRTDLSTEKIKGIAFDFKEFKSSNIENLDNGAFWKSNGEVGFTYLPKEKLDEIRTTLQSEMGVDTSKLAKLNDSPIYPGDVAAGVTTKKATKPAVKAEPVEKASSAQTTQAEEQKVLPPPDIVAPDGAQSPGTDSSNGHPDPNAGGSEQMQPPPDIVPPTNPPPSSAEQSSAGGQVRTQDQNNL